MVREALLVAMVGAVACKATEAPPRVLFDVPAGDPAALRLAIGGRGRRAILAWGFEGQAASPSFLELGAGAEPAGAPAALYANAKPRWRCLAAAASRTDFAVTTLDAAGERPDFHLAELAE